MQKHIFRFNFVLLAYFSVSENLFFEKKIEVYKEFKEMYYALNIAVMHFLHMGCECI